MNLRNELFAKYGAETGKPYKAGSALPATPDELKTIFSLLDLTTLNSDDNDETARRFTGRLNGFAEAFPGWPPVAAICIYPLLADEVRKTLTAPGVKVAAVGAGFPSSQTFLAVKVAECGLLASKGVDEIDVVISAGKFIAGDYMDVLNELILIREACTGVTLKVILETGLLRSAEEIRLASLIAMEAGADFIKTSTGKVAVSATPEAVQVMVTAIGDYFSVTGRPVGIKPAGGIAEVPDALTYYRIVEEKLGSDWLVPARFRIGASRLANNLLSAAAGSEIRYF
jgi:deoxyribose-phosphate aldolase